MTHSSNNIDQTKLYTTGRIPTFTFVVDGPDAPNKKVNESQLDQNAESTSNTHKQQKEYNNDTTTATTTTTRTVPSGALHIVPSWQPLDANDRPPYSYATLIAHSILSSEHRRLTLCDIYQWITQHYPFYSMTEHGWQNSIRHNLSLNKAFVRIQRSSKTNSGKGSFWIIRTGQELVFIDNLIKRRGPIRKQPVNLPRTLQHRRSSHRLNTTDHHDASIHTTTTRHTNNNSSHLFTTFRMTPTPSPSLSTPALRSSSGRPTNRKRSMPELNRQQPLVVAATDDGGNESDCDSGVDFGHVYPKKETRSTFNNNTNTNNYRSQLKKAKSTPCLYDDDHRLYNNDATMMDYTFQTLLSTSSLSSAATTTDDLSNWTHPMDIVPPPLFEWDPLFPTTAAMNLPPAADSPAFIPSSCMVDMSYQHLQQTSTSTDPTFPMLESSPSPLGHQPPPPPFAPTTTSANGLFLCHDYMFDQPFLMTSWPV